MDKVKKYQQLLIEYLDAFAKRSRLANMPDVENKVIADLQNNSFQMLRIGWQGQRYVFSVVFHFDIKDGKVWFQRNITERDVVDELIEMGIPPEDIVLGFQPHYARPYRAGGCLKAFLSPATTNSCLSRRK
jgi:hypothetical protein